MLKSCKKAESPPSSSTDWEGEITIGDTFLDADTDGASEKQVRAEGEPDLPEPSLRSR